MESKFIGIRIRQTLSTNIFVFVDGPENGIRHTLFKNWEEKDD